ncbi:hypothetical protein HUO13_19590 [Saccharopolyspora erythraea]|uniref:hypothetical protein n=1 Tax=Saccharopolyspora erythraea TaxID=1836 RepID=UPI001BA82C70|nr:hypothetical protein [Saccharopolyspora erythraea]QUH02711.1 hypothetical protein HUO13_19590 [Saccharopolyspora erythraea]
MDPETPEADAAEQARETIVPAEDEETELAGELSPEVDPADLAEQNRPVPADDDGYEEL